MRIGKKIFFSNEYFIGFITKRSLWTFWFNHHLHANITRRGIGIQTFFDVGVKTYTILTKNGVGVANFVLRVIGIVQRDYFPWRLLSKWSFASQKLAQIDYNHFLCKITIKINHKMEENSLKSFKSAHSLKLITK